MLNTDDDLHKKLSQSTFVSVESVIHLCCELFIKSNSVHFTAVGQTLYLSSVPAATKIYPQSFISRVIFPCGKNKTHMERAALSMALAPAQCLPGLKCSSSIQAVPLMSTERNSAGPGLLSKLPTAKVKVTS